MAENNPKETVVKPTFEGAVVFDQNAGPSISQTLPIPKEFVGYLIGKGGSTLKGIMKGSSTKIFIQQSEKDVMWEFLHVSGSARSVNRAKKIIINALIRAAQTKRKKKENVDDFGLPAVSKKN